MGVEMNLGHFFGGEGGCIISTQNWLRNGGGGVSPFFWEERVKTFSKTWVVKTFFPKKLGD